MIDKVKELLLKEDVYSMKYDALSILFLQYKMAEDTEGNNQYTRENFSYFNFSKDNYDTNIKELEKFYSINIDVKNPFTAEVVCLLVEENLVDRYNNHLKIKESRGIGYLRKENREIIIDWSDA